MKLHILSDLHNELGSPFQPTCTDADVTILAGDIAIGADAMHWAREVFPGRVLLVPGNHERWDGTLQQRLRELRAVSCERVQLLERDAVVIDGVRFLGTTAWTDYSLDPEMGINLARRASNDFHRIKWELDEGARTLEPEDLVQINHDIRDWLTEQLLQEFDGKTVVITHHAPLQRCLEGANATRRDRLHAPSYANTWQGLLWQVPAPALWVFGHSHNASDQMLGDTRFVSNPLGYAGYETVAGFDPALTIDV